MAPHLVRFDDLLAGFDWVNAEPMQNSAYVSRRTGQVHWVSEVIELDDELPDDIEDTSVYVAIPSKNDLRLGKSLAQKFTREHIPDEFGRVVAFFHHRGPTQSSKTCSIEEVRSTHGTSTRQAKRRDRFAPGQPKRTFTSNHRFEQAAIEGG